MADRKSVTSTVVGKALKDPAFREQLLKDPKGAIRKATGVELPPDADIRVVEETPNRWYIVLPAVPAQAQPGGELTDEQLENVAGGAGCFLTTIGNSDCWNLKTDCCASTQTTGQKSKSW